MFFEMAMKSEELSRHVHVNVLIPKVEDGQEYKTLWLLHGLSCDYSSWMRKTSIERYAQKYGIAVVMPDGGRSWYTDTVCGENYFTFITKELPEVCHSCFKGMSDKREDNIIGGFSMGGYGAMKMALTYPEKYGACISLSGALDITRKGRPTNLSEWQRIFDYNMKTPDELEGTKHDLFALLRENVKEKRDLPKLYLWCGLEDTLIDINRTFCGELEAFGVEHTFEQSEGDHTWKWWDMHIKSGLENILG